MFGNPSLMTRIAIGKAIGFLFGLAGFNVLPYFLADAGSLLRWGVLLQTSRTLNKKGRDCGLSHVHTDYSLCILFPIKTRSEFVRLFHGHYNLRVTQHCISKKSRNRSCG